MKLSFSLSSKSQPKKPSVAAGASVTNDGQNLRALESSQDTSTRKQYITEFDPSISSTESKTLTIPPKPNELQPRKRLPFESSQDTSTRKQYITEFDPLISSTESKTITIPPKPNEWQPRKRMKNLDLPLTEAPENQPLQFEVDHGANIEAGSDSISYGLNIRHQNGEGNESKPPPGVDPLLQKFKDDLRSLPEDNELEDYNDVPVEAFGAALLGGYGWKEGRGIGRNTKEDVKIHEIKKWAGKGGLGFMGNVPRDLPSGKDSKKESKVGEYVGTVDDRDVRTNGRHEEKGGLYVGKEVRVVNGREMGIKGKVVEVRSGGDIIVLRLLRSEEEVVVRSGDVAELGSVEEGRCLSKLKDLKIREKDLSGGRERSGERGSDSSSRKSHRADRDQGMKDRRKERKQRGGEDAEMKDRKEEKKRDREEYRESGKVRWLTSHIRVRIVSKELKGGRLYLKKGEVVDVVGPTMCDISLEKSRELIQGVDQDSLETALPKRGGPVLVLYGQHKGVYGSLVERNTEKETGVVRDADTHELLNVRLEQIAEYIGDPSYIGY